MTMRINMQYRVPIFRRIFFRQTLRAAIEEHLRNAVREWLKGYNVPVDTGMAKGSALNLAFELGVALQISPRSTNKTYYDGATRMPKTPASGASLSPYAFNWTGSVFAFHWETDIVHLNIKDPAEWHQWEQGIRRMEAYIRNLRQRALLSRLSLSNFLIDSAGTN